MEAWLGCGIVIGNMAGTGDDHTASVSIETGRESGPSL